MASHGLSTSESSVGGSSSDDEGWQDDVAEDLDIFVRLSKAGHFNRAESFFRAFLKNHIGDFAVAAQYAENLIEQGSFGPAEKFLDALLSSGLDVDDEERDVLRLLLFNARIYTQFDVERAASTAIDCLGKVGSLVIAEDMSPLKLQTVIISLRLLDLGCRTRQSSIFDENCWPFKLDRKPDQDPTWKEVIIALLKYGHIWEANTLLAIHLRHGRPTKPDLLRIIDSIPEKSDTMYHLLGITILVLCSQSLLKQKGRPLASGVFGLCERCARHLRFSAMDGITDPISSSRAYQEYKLLDLEFLKNQLPSNSWGRFYSSRSSHGSIGMRAARETALKNSDYMLLLAVHEQDAYPLPNQWLDSTGASREAIACLHPDATLLEEEFHAAESDAGDTLPAASDDAPNSHKGKIAQSQWEFGSTSTEMDPGSEPWNDYM